MNIALDVAFGILVAYGFIKVNHAFWEFVWESWELHQLKKRWHV